jgi:site-specific recombinase XerD
MEQKCAVGWINYLRLGNENALDASRAFSFMPGIRAFAPHLAVSSDCDRLINQFVDWIRVERNFSEQTVSTYQRSIRRFVTEAVVTGPEDIAAQDVLRVKRSLLARGCSASYIAIIMLATRSFLGYCRTVLRLNVLDPSLLTPPKRPRRQVHFLTADEVHRFVASIALERRWTGRRRAQGPRPRGFLYRALVEVLLGTGMRISEALSLRRSAIDWVKQEARIVGKGDKQRTVFFTVRALHWLRRYLDLRTDARDEVFVTHSGNPLDRRTVVRWFAQQGRRAGLSKRVTAHVLRHTVATTLMFNGCPMGHIKEILGHERLDTTCRYYLGLDTREAQKAHQKYLRYRP